MERRGGMKRSRDEPRTNWKDVKPEDIAGMSRKQRKQTGSFNGAPAVIIPGFGAIPVENRYEERKQREFELRTQGAGSSGRGGFRSFGGSSRGGFGAVSGVSKPAGKFEECWICGGTDHRRSNCPNKFEEGGKMIQAKVVCLGCRRRGHLLKDCPNRSGGLGVDSADGLADGGVAGAGGTACFNCGETGHRLKDCTAPKVAGGAGFATCFICHQKGHLSRDCPKNEHGVYPRGGACLRCGSKMHFIKDCPEGDPRAQGGADAGRGNKRFGGGSKGVGMLSGNVDERADAGAGAASAAGDDDAAAGAFGGAAASSSSAAEQQPKKKAVAVASGDDLAGNADFEIEHSGKKDDEEGEHKYPSHHKGKKKHGSSGGGHKKGKADRK